MLDPNIDHSKKRSAYTAFHVREGNGDGSRLHTRYREKSGRSPAAYPSGVTSKNQPTEERKRSAFGAHSRGDKTAIELWLILRFGGYSKCMRGGL